MTGGKSVVHFRQTRPESGASTPEFGRGIDILLLEDDITTLRLLRRLLRPIARDVVLVTRLREAVHVLQSNRFDLAVLDYHLPDGQSLELGRKLMEVHGTRVIFVSGVHEPKTRVQALEMGAADWVAKPFFPQELMARALRVWRQGPATRRPATGERRFRFSGWAFLPLDCELVSPAGTVVGLDIQHARLLALLLEHAGKLVTPDMIALAVPDRPWRPADSRIPGLVEALRSLIRQHDDRNGGSRPRIRTIGRRGYALQAEVTVV